MPEQAKTTQQNKSAARQESGKVSDVETLTAFGFDKMSVFGTAWLEVFGEMGSEMMSFMADRVREDVKTQHELLNCNDFSEVQAIQARFVKRAIEQYTDETGKMIGIGQQMLRGPAKN